MYLISPEICCFLTLRAKMLVLLADWPYWLKSRENMLISYKLDLLLITFCSLFSQKSVQIKPKIPLHFMQKNECGFTSNRNNCLNIFRLKTKKGERRLPEATVYVRILEVKSWKTPTAGECEAK